MFFNKNTCIINSILIQTIAVTQNLVACRLELNFEDPERFMPERWLRNDAGRAPPVNPYLVLPFGHGMRACIARRLAEQSMLVLVLNVSSRYKRYMIYLKRQNITD